MGQIKIKQCCKTMEKDYIGDFDISSNFVISKPKFFIERVHITDDDSGGYHWKMQITHCPFCGKELSLKWSDYIPETHRIIKINGYNYGLTKAGRFRKHWKQQYRTQKAGFGKCEKCGKHRKLTINHDPPLRFDVKGKTEKICWYCHSQINRLDIMAEKGKTNSNIHKCTCTHYNYFDFNRKVIFCKYCKKERQSKQTGENQYIFVEKKK